MSDPHKINPEVMDLPPPYPVDFRPASGLESPTSMDGFDTPIVDFTGQMPAGRLVINASSPVPIENSVQGTSGLNGMELKQESATQFRLYSKRWFMLLIYGINVSIGNMNSIAFATVADIVGEYLGTEVSAVNYFNTMSNAVLLPPIGPILAHYAEKWGIRFTFYSVAVFQSLGSLIRCGAIFIDLILGNIFLVLNFHVFLNSENELHNKNKCKSSKQYIGKNTSGVESTCPYSSTVIHEFHLDLE